MTVKDLLNQQVTVLRNVSIIESNDKTSIGNILFNIGPRWKDRINELRDILNTKGSKEYKKAKVNTPVWFPHGSTNGGTHDADMVTFTNIIALDIDVKEGENDNVDINGFREDFFSKPYVIAVLESLSGKGLYALVYVKDYHHNIGYYQYFRSLLKKKYGIVLDMSATNPARKRFISYEDDIEKWVKPMDTDMVPWELYLNEEIDELFKDEPIQQHEIQRYIQTSMFKDDYQIERTHQAMWLLLNNGFNAQDRGYWYHIAKDLAAFPDGRAMFDKLCSNWGSQDKKSIEPTWKSCEKEPNPINDEMHRRWQGMAKTRFGAGWWKKHQSTS